MSTGEARQAIQEEEREYLSGAKMADFPKTRRDLDDSDLPGL